MVTLAEIDAVHERLGSADTETFTAVLAQVERGELGYVEMSSALAACGVCSWTFDTGALTLSHRDAAGADLLVEQLP